MATVFENTVVSFQLHHHCLSSRRDGSLYHAHILAVVAELLDSSESQRGTPEEKAEILYAMPCLAEVGLAKKPRLPWAYSLSGFQLFQSELPYIGCHGCDPCQSVFIRGSLLSSGFLRFFGPGVFQRDGAVEDGLAGLGVRVEGEVGEALELVAGFGVGFPERRLAFGGHDFE